MKTITILLTTYSDWTSFLIHHLVRQRYTHVSISLGGVDEEYYSFNYHGFCTETCERHRRRGVTESLAYELEISDEAWHNMTARIEEFRANRQDYHYTRLGVLLCFLHIPIRLKGRYFCSQFVAEVLQESGAVTLSHRPTLCLPNHLGRELPHCPQYVRTCYNPVAA